jgi:hypothetical protein
MSFKINPPYVVDNTPIHMVDLGDNIMGRTNKNGVVLVNKRLSDKDIKKVIAHEKVHVEQFKNGDLDYDDNNVYFKGVTYKRSKIKEGSRNLPWESPAYKASDNV